MMKIKRIIGTSIVSVALGFALGTWVASGSGLISDFFKSEHYITAQQSDKYAMGVVIGYGVIYAVLLAGLLLLKSKSAIRFSYIATLVIGGLVAIWWRGFSSLSNLDCGYNCVDTVVPLSTTETATIGVKAVIAGVGLLFVVIYLVIQKVRSK